MRVYRIFLIMQDSTLLVREGFHDKSGQSDDMGTQIHRKEKEG